MVRRKMLLFLVSLIGLFLIVAIAAIWLLQGVLSDLDHTGVQDAAVVETANQMGETVTRIEIELRRIQLHDTRHLDSLVDEIENLHGQATLFGEQFPRPIPEAGPVNNQIIASLKVFQEQVGMLATAQDDALAQAHMDAAITASIELRENTLIAGRMMRDHISGEERRVIVNFRWVVLALAIIFVLMINISVMVMLRMSHMVVRPVEQLVEASRRLAHEEFDYRVQLPQSDEFGELAAAYNHLAEQLQANERRKLETLAQTAVMLNHELNNASAIIRLQLQLLERQSTGSAAFERCLRQINESLSRMTATVEALKHIRRIVLTDYSADTKMLDLKLSVAEEPLTRAAKSAAAAHN